MELLTVFTFLLWTISVAVITAVLVTKYVRKADNAADDYFAGGNSLKWYVVAGSLMLTNLSSEQLVGLNGAVFEDGNLVGIWWEGGASLTMMITASVFLEVYMRQGIITTSSFLGERYDLTVRSMVSLVFVVYYSAILCPLVLYAGAIAVQEIFQWGSPGPGQPAEVELWILTTAIGTLGAIYAISGGLKAVAISDCLNGIGLLVVGLYIPYRALSYLPNGFYSLFDEPDLLKVLVSESRVYNSTSSMREMRAPSIPWHVVPFGITLNNMYYWATNQLIVQRALGAESLAEAQKGVLFAACMKVIGFTFLCIPGLIAVLMKDEAIVDESNNLIIGVVTKVDKIYPMIARAVMPEEAKGLFLGVLIGTVLSTFNSALNSAATMFSLELYKVFIDQNASDEFLVKVANVFGLILTGFSFIIAPEMANLGQNLFNQLQTWNTIVSLPILSVFFVGIFLKLPTALAAKFGFIAGFVAIMVAQSWKDEIHYLHLFVMSFVYAVAVILFVTYLPVWFPSCRQWLSEPVEWKAKDASKVDLTPWKWRYHVMIALVVNIVVLLVSLQFASVMGFITFWILWIITAVALVALPTGTDVLSSPKSRSSVDHTEMS